MKRITKAIIASLTALGTWGTTAMADGQVDGVEAFGLCGVVVAGLAVWAGSNEPGTPTFTVRTRSQITKN